MRILLLHLSDIHFVEGADHNPVLARVDLITSAAASETTRISACFLIISGDTAFSGHPHEYTIATDFLSTLRTGLRERFPGAPLETVVIPGNHDCVLVPENKARDIVIDHLDLNALDGSIVDTCTGPQSHYQAFSAAQTGLPVPGRPIEKLYRRRVFSVGTKTIGFHLYNSAWVSRYHETPGRLLMPIAAIREEMAAPFTVDLAVSLIHHPFNWFEPSNARDLRSIIEKTSDIILTGHEHVADSYTKRMLYGEETEFLEGGVLQESGNPTSSSFNTVLVDLEAAEQQLIHYELTDSSKLYAATNNVVWRPLGRNKGRLRDEFEINDAFLSELHDAGAKFTHPNVDTVKLSDLFVYPSFQGISRTKEAGPTDFVRGKEIVSYVLKYGHVLVLGADKSGKSSLAKTLLLDLQKEGKVPLLIEGGEFESPDEKKLRRVLDQAFASEYAPALRERYWQLDKSARAIIVDNFQRVFRNRQGRDELLATLSSLFGTIVIVSGEEVRFEELAQRGESGGTVWEFKHIEILPFGHVLRSQLVKRWLSLGTDNSKDEARFSDTVVKTEHLLNLVLLRDLLPAYPIYILILLQQMEIGKSLHTSSGSIGFLYEALITATFAQRRTDRISIDAKYNYLAEFAYFVFSQGRFSAPIDDVRSWHDKYCKFYHLKLNFDGLLDGFVAVGMLERLHGHAAFKYTYAFYYFIARYLRDHLHEPTIKQLVDAIASKLYNEMCANITIFLCHLSKESSILDGILKTADELLKDELPFDLDKGVHFLNTLQVDLPNLALDGADSESHRQAMLEEKDNYAPVDHTAKNGRELMKIERIVEDEEIALLNEAVQINAAFKTIQILGQILRNFSGSLSGEAKLRITKSCYMLGLRTMSFVIRSIETNTEYLASAFVVNYFGDAAEGGPAKLDEAKRKADRDDLKRLANNFVFNVSEMNAFSIVKHISDSVGMNDLSPTFNAAVTKHSAVSERVIDISVRLDHYDEFPVDETVELAADLRKNMFSQYLVKHLAWYKLYMYPVDFKVRQEVCDKLKIPMREAMFLNPNVKKQKSLPAKKKRGR